MRLIKVKNFIKRAPKRSPWLAYFGINLPHPYRTSSAGPNAGGSTFKTSPYYLKKVEKSKITIPKWNNFEDLHPGTYSLSLLFDFLSFQSINTQLLRKIAQADGRRMKSAKSERIILRCLRR